MQLLKFLMSIAIKQRMDLKIENHTHLYLQAHKLHKKEVENGKKVKKAENSPTPLLVQAKKYL